MSSKTLSAAHVDLPPPPALLLDEMLYSCINSVEAAISCSNCRPQDQCDHIQDGSGAGRAL